MMLPVMMATCSGVLPKWFGLSIELRGGVAPNAECRSELAKNAKKNRVRIKLLFGGELICRGKSSKIFGVSHRFKLVLSKLLRFLVSFSDTVLKEVLSTNGEYYE